MCPHVTYPPLEFEQSSLNFSILKICQGLPWKEKMVIARSNKEIFNRELKQHDAAAERRQSTSKFLFRRTQSQVNSFGLDIIHS